MPERRSGSAQETRDREQWLTHLLETDPDKRAEASSILATATLVRAATEGIEVPQEAEEHSRQRLLAELPERGQREPERAPRAPWFLRFGSAMRFVFTLGRRR